MIALFSVANVLFVGALIADKPPRFDVESYCERIANSGGGSNMIRNSCLEMEQDAYNRLKAVWPTIPDATKSYCSRIATVSGDGSYSILESCIDMEQDSSQEADDFNFDY